MPVWLPPQKTEIESPSESTPESDPLGGDVGVGVGVGVVVVVEPPVPFGELIAVTGAFFLASVVAAPAVELQPHKVSAPASIPTPTAPWTILFNIDLPTPRKQEYSSCSVACGTMVDLKA
jgi:hypothetical protein